MSNDDKSKWVNKIKRSKELSRDLGGGGEVTPVPKDSDGKGDFGKFAEEIKKKNADKPKFKDFDEVEKDFDKPLNKEKSAVKPDERDAKLDKASLEHKKANAPKAEKKLIEKIDDLVDKAGQGLKKAAPYLNNTVKVIGEFGKVGGLAGGVVGFFYPESTATDEEMRLHELKAQENQQRHKEIFQESPEPSKLKPHKKSSLTEEKENIMLAMKDSEMDKPSFFTEPPIIENEPKISIEEKERVLLAMRDINEVRPLFLEKIEPEIIKEINMPEPSFDGDSSDGGDGGGD